MKSAIKKTILLLCVAALAFVSCLAEDYVFNDGYNVGGKVSRNVGTLTLKNSITGETVSMTGNGSFMFAKMLEEGDTYNIVVEKDPVDQVCTVVNGSGSIAGSEVNGIGVMCSTISKQAKQGNLTVSSNYPTFEVPVSAGSITINLGVQADVLITMTSSLGSTASAVSYARLLVDGTPIAQARATTDATKVYPVTFSNVVTLQPGSHTISPAYSVSTAGMTVDDGIGGFITATVLSTVPGYQRYISTSMSGASITSSVPGVEIEIPGLNSSTGVLVGSKTVIRFLPFTEMRWSPLDTLSVMLTNDTVADATSTFTSSIVDEYIPMTLFEAISYSDGNAHTFGARCRMAAVPTTMVIENDFPTTISGIVMDTKTVQSGSENTVTTSPYGYITKSGTLATYSLVFLNNSIVLNTPSRLLVALTMEKMTINAGNVPTYFALVINDTSTIIGEACVKTTSGVSAMPLSIISATSSTVKNGDSLIVYVKTASSGYTVSGWDTKLTVMRLD